MHPSSPPSDAWRIRRALPGDEDALRQLRIEALSDSPEQFGSTLDRERARTPEDWRSWIANAPTFFLQAGDQLRGLVCGVYHDDEPGAVFLVSMWVHPELRGSGGSAALVTALLQLLDERGVAQVYLEVVCGNESARRLYERHGFRATGGERPRGGLVEVEMLRARPG